MRVLVVGYGSVGKRHVANLRNIEGIEEIIVCSKLKEESEENRRINLIFVSSLNEALSRKASIDFAIVANETHKHIETALTLSERGINLFIEKPLSHNLENIDALQEIADKKKLKMFVAYNLRFLGALNYIKNQIALRTIGDLYFAKIEVGQYLPLWRTSRDYRDSYSSSSQKGGGVALDLSHEIDYMRHIFGDPIRWKVIKTRVGNLEIDVDDVFEGIYLYENFLCNVHMDYLQQNAKRDIRIVGSDGIMTCDFIKKCINVETVDGKEMFINDAKLFDINSTYIEELHHFINSLKQTNEAKTTLAEGIRALQLLEDSYV